MKMYFNNSFSSIEDSLSFLIGDSLDFFLSPSVNHLFRLFNYLKKKDLFSVFSNYFFLTMTSTPGRSPGCCRGYTNEQKTLRSKLDLIIKWGRDLKSNLMKQSCKALQTNNPNTRETIDQIHDDLDDYKRKLDRELGLIHDICDALTINNQLTIGDEENVDDDILEALRRSPTYTSLEQHIFDDKRPRIRVKPRERIHPIALKELCII